MLGFAQILEALKFLNVDCNLVHGNVTPSSVFVSESGDWKLGSFGLTSEYKESGTPHLWVVHPKYVAAKYQDPERQSGRQRAASSWSSDVWSFAVTMRSIGVASLPPAVEKCCAKMSDRAARKRPSPQKILAQRFFANEPLVSVVRELQNWALLNTTEQIAFFRKLTPLVATFPKCTCRHKILPTLLETMRVAEKSAGSAAASVALAPLLTIGKDLEDDAFVELIVPPVARLFASNNRATRLQLLQHSEAVVPKLPSKMVNDRIFKNILSGFGDTVPALREWTIRSMIHVVPVLNDANKNTLIEQFRKLIRDPLPPIRNNVVVCLMHIANDLPAKTRVKSLLQLFAAALRDPVANLRKASLAGLSRIGGSLEPHIRARSVLPMVVTLVVDPDKGVRDAAHDVCQSLLKDLRSYTPPELPEDKSKGEKSAARSAHIGKMPDARAASKATTESLPRNVQDRKFEDRRRIDNDSRDTASSSSRWDREKDAARNSKGSDDFFSNWVDEDTSESMSPKQVTEDLTAAKKKEQRKAERRARLNAKREAMRQKREQKRIEKKKKREKSVVVAAKASTGWDDDDDFMEDFDMDDDVRKVTPSKKTSRGRISGMKLSSGSRKKSGGRLGSARVKKKKDQDVFAGLGDDDDDDGDWGGGDWG
eukprot:g2880.t1